MIAQEVMITPDNYTPAEPQTGPVNSVNRDGMEDIFSTLLVLALTGNSNIIPKLSGPVLPQIEDAAASAHCPDLITPYSSDLTPAQSDGKAAVILHPALQTSSPSVAVIQQSEETSNAVVSHELYAGLSSEVTSPQSDDMSSIIPDSAFRTPHSATTGVVALQIPRSTLRPPNSEVSLPLSDDMSSIIPQSALHIPHSDDISSGNPQSAIRNPQSTQDGIIQQLSQRLIHASHIGAHTVKIRLKPEELGELQMDISVIDKSIKAVITVENYSVKEIIEANLGRLEDALKNHGFKIEQFTVDMRGGDMRDRWTPSLFYGGDAGTRRWGSNAAVNDRVERFEKDIVVPLESGIISVFA
ncbi:MAG: flagellar hook-length control protein FliK [Nitrospirae bacterium]|nr:flagellar hook-length control protein FliK [Nitrospirota bacterium]